MITFGPVPSRRLGRSLGINNIPPKTCSLSCIYCQVGKTNKLQVTRQPFYEPQAIVDEVAEKIRRTEEQGEEIDFLAFVPDGEPTLDCNLGKTIDLLRPLGKKIAIINNATLLWQDEVREDLCKADWVSLKVDAVSPKVWRRIDRPHKELQLQNVLDSMLQFKKEFTGTLVSETMLLRGVNDTPEVLTETASFLEKLSPSTSYLSIPIRPTVEKIASIPDEEALNTAYQIIHNKVENVECLFGYEGDTFSSTGNAEEDLLNIIAVHPMREQAVQEFLANTQADWSLIDKLIEQDRIFVTTYENNRFYLRRLHKK
ncbi:radical SAM protein [Halodesulfovibrio sp.]|uniref:radical SAM protein n=1 Tax=Halodesulfovibrio sp. TaxID=1912772 RepID=UPI0025BBB64A|nr:radical SAM protein [Halodesulfovibrio sp.]